MSGLFYSATTQEILAILCQSPQQSFHVNELIRLTGEYPNSVTHALRGLEKTGLVKFRREGKRKLYQINTANPIYPELRSIFSKLGVFIDKKLKPLEEKAKITWVKIINRDSSLPLAATVYAAYKDRLAKITGVSFRYGWYNGVTGGIYEVQEEFKSVEEKLKLRLGRNIGLTARLIKQFKKSCQEVVSCAQEAAEGRLFKESNKKLAERLRKFYLVYLNQIAFMSFPGTLENWLLEEIKKEVKQALKKNSRANELKKFIELLTVPILIIKEQNEALKIADCVKKNGFSKKAADLLVEHTQRWSHLPVASFSDLPFGYDHFKNEIEILAERFSNPLEEIKKHEQRENGKLKEIKKAVKELNLSPKTRKKIKLYQDIFFLRSDRWDFIHRSHLLLLPLADEVARRLNLTRQSLDLLTYEEMIKFLASGTRANKALIAKRKRGWAVFLWEGEVRIVSGINEIVETIERFRIVDETKGPPMPEETLAEFKDTYQLKGIPAFKGKVSGPVRVVLSREDFRKVKEGDIIVAYQTTPQYLSCLYRAAGLIIDEANPTSHAVLYAQALKLPAIVGTKFGTKFFHDNDHVFLNATKGIAKKIGNPNFDNPGGEKEYAYLKN